MKRLYALENRDDYTDGYLVFASSARLAIKWLARNLEDTPENIIKQYTVEEANVAEAD